MVFDASSTAADITQVWGHLAKDKYILVTGASSGIGAESARVLGLAGAHVWLGGRDLDKTKKVADEIAKLVEDPSRIHTIGIDLSSISSVRRAVVEYLSLNVPLDILLNNAGCMAIQTRTLTEDNFEMQIGTNHFGHFELTNGLLPCMRSGSRIVNLSSQAHFRGPVLFDDMHFKTTPYEGWASYAQSKTANILHAVELNKRYSSQGITAVSLHPGVIMTELWRHIPDNTFAKNKTIPQGAATSVYCALNPDIVGGAYYNDCALFTPAPYASESGNAAKLWDISVNTLAQIETKSA